MCVQTYIFHIKNIISVIQLFLFSITLTYPSQGEHAALEKCLVKRETAIMSLIATIMIKANTKHFIVICYKCLIKKVNALK